MLVGCTGMVAGRGGEVAGWGAEVAGCVLLRWRTVVHELGGLLRCVFVSCKRARCCAKN